MSLKGKFIDFAIGAAGVVAGTLGGTILVGGAILAAFVALWPLWVSVAAVTAIGRVLGWW